MGLTATIAVQAEPVQSCRGGVDEANIGGVHEWVGTRGVISRDHCHVWRQGGVVLSDVRAKGVSGSFAGKVEFGWVHTDD